MTSGSVRRTRPRQTDYGVHAVVSKPPIRPSVPWMKTESLVYGECLWAQCLYRRVDCWWVSRCQCRSQTHSRCVSLFLALVLVRLPCHSFYGNRASRTPPDKLFGWDQRMTSGVTWWCLEPTPILSHKSDPYHLLNLPEGLRAYGPRFGGNGASKCTKNLIFHCGISTILWRPVTIKNTIR